MNENRKLYISIFVVIMAFILGFLTCYFYLQKTINYYENKKYYVEIEELKTKYKITPITDKTFIVVNGKIHEKFDLKK